MTPEEHKKITGFSTPTELAAYEKGRDNEQEVTIKWIEEWDGSTNSVMGELLNRKMLELSKKQSNFEIFKKEFDKNFGKVDPF